MKHAFLVIAHNNWWQLKQLITLLDDVEHDIYVHIDQKSKDFRQEDFEGIVKKSKIYFYQEYKVYWGGYSIVQVEMLLFEEAYKKGYDYYHVLSGADLPLKSNKELHDFFEKNRGLEFISYDEDKLNNDPEIRRRTRLYHFLQNYRRGFKIKQLNSFFTFCERVLLVMQIVLHVNRVKKIDWTIKYGSQWVSVTHKLVGVLIQNREKIKKVFSYTNCADELFIQTVAYNCGFKNVIYQDSCTQKTENMRLIDWERGANGNPYTFCLKDYDWLMSQDGYLFARKFSETVDREIIYKIYNKIRA